jgi:hypothetical protein
MRPWLALVPWLLAPQDTHVHVTTPLLTNDTIEKEYGPPEVVELMHIAYNGIDYERKNVLTRGVLEVLVPGRYLSLREGAATVMIVPLGSGAYSGLAQMAGLDVDLAGIVRNRHQPDDTPCHRGIPGTCDNPRLPLLPGEDNEPLLPRVTITAYRVTDRGTGMTRGRSGGRTLADTGLDAAIADGKPIRAIGQFRGGNLCRDLPEATRRLGADWVLLTSEGPVWVTGRRPEGKGFRLDPAYRADLSRWLEVGGRVEAAGEVRYLKASSVTMIARPRESEDNPCPP